MREVNVHYIDGTKSRRDSTKMWRKHHKDGVTFRVCCNDSKRRP